jgi:hypothetical protein
MILTPGKVNNLTQIPSRSHSDLQNLTADDHKQYSHLIGLDADKPASGVVVGALYFATDTFRLYRYNGSSWSEIKLKTLFTELRDAPASYTGHAGKFVRVKNSEDGIEFASPDQFIEQSGTWSPYFSSGGVQTTTINFTYPFKKISLYVHNYAQGTAINSYFKSWNKDGNNNYTGMVLEAITGGGGVTLNTYWHVFGIKA